MELFHYSENTIIRPARLGRFSNHLKKIVERLKGEERPRMESKLKFAVDEVVQTMKAQDDVMT